MNQCRRAEERERSKWDRIPKIITLDGKNDTPIEGVPILMMSQIVIIICLDQ